VRGEVWEGSEGRSVEGSEGRSGRMRGVSGRSVYGSQWDQVCRGGGWREEEERGGAAVWQGRGSGQVLQGKGSAVLWCTHTEEQSRSLAPVSVPGRPCNR